MASLQVLGVIKEKEDFRLWFNGFVRPFVYPFGRLIWEKIVNESWMLGES